jgi:hypothetical protein
MMSVRRSGGTHFCPQAGRFSSYQIYVAQGFSHCNLGLETSKVNERVDEGDYYLHPCNYYLRGGFLIDKRAVNEQ